MGQFCDAGCMVTFTKTKVYIFNRTGRLILDGFREKTGARMWRFNIHAPHPHTALQASPTHNSYTPHVIPFNEDEDEDMPTNQHLAIQQGEVQAPPTVPPQIQATTRSSTPQTVPQQIQATTRSSTRVPPARSTEYHRRTYDLPSTKHLIEYLHCCVGSPTKRTFLTAVKAGNFKSFPGLSVENVARYCPANATATVLGHLTQTPKGVRSTRWAAAAHALMAANASPAMLPSDVLLEELTAPTNTVTIIEVPISTLYTDDMGRFPIRAQSGNQYIMVAFHDATNVILVEPFKTKADHHRIPAYDSIMRRLKTRGLTVDMQVMDNEVSEKFLRNITEVWKCKFQKVPPDMHRRNKAERAIRTFKAHFITILACVDQSFPRNRWDLLLPQAEITINLLRQSRLYPNISAWEHFNGPFNFDATPLGPPGCKIIAHAKGSTRLSWDYRGHIGFYVGPAMDHYRCHKVIKIATSAVMISDTVVFQHPTLSVPTLTTTDRIIHCLRALTIAVRADRTQDNCNAQLLAVESLRAIFDKAPSTTPQTTTPSQPVHSAPLTRVIVASVPAPRVDAAPPRVIAAPNPPSIMQPIAHRTRSNRVNTNSIAASANSSLRVTFSLPSNHIDKSTLSRDTQYDLSAQWNDVPNKNKKPIILQLPRLQTALPPSNNKFALLADTLDDDLFPTNAIALPMPPTNTTFDLLENEREFALLVSKIDDEVLSDLLADDLNDDTLPTDTIACTVQELPSDAELPTIFIACPVLDHETGQTLEHGQLRRHPKYKAIWDASYADEIFRLCQGGGKHLTKPNQLRIQGTNTMRPIMFHDIPHDRKSDVAHTRVVCEVRPTKADPNRTRVTIGGNTINYLGDCGTKTASIETVKLVINSTLSTPNAEYMTMDLANFYLGTPLDRPEYVRIKLSVIPQEVIDEYDLEKYAINGWVYFEITKGMYGLKQAGKLANELLATRLFSHGYYQCATTPGLWRHKWRPVIFALIVDDFGVQYTSRQNAEHLQAALSEHYEVTTDWTGSKFSGIDLKWDYMKRTCRLTMDGYIANLRIKVGHPDPKKPQHSPHKHRKITYGAASQLITDDIDNSPPLDAAGIRKVQSIVGSLLFYARAVDNKLLYTVSAIGMNQASATQNTLDECNWLLDHLALYPNDGITYKASNMIACAHSDASYLSESNSRSRAGAHIFLSNDDPIPQDNGPVQSSSTVLRSVYASAGEAETAACFKCARDMVPLRNALNEMGWPQPRSPIQLDNSTAEGFANNTIIVKRMRAIEMRLNWLKDREAQGQFRFYWDKGTRNKGDYHTKRHPLEYHIAHRPTHAG